MDRVAPNQPTSRPALMHGFTLIELLVVIAIIAILAAILFPVFAKVREKARQTQCLSNMKQINLGMMQYLEDYDETWPDTVIGLSPAGLYNFPYTTQNTWAFAIYPYVKNKAVYTCPDDPYLSNLSVNQNFKGPDFNDIAKTFIPIMQFNEDGGAQANNETAILVDGHGGTSGKENTDASIPYPASTVWLTEAGPNINLTDGSCWNNPCEDLNVVSAGIYVNDRGNVLQPGGSKRNYVANNHTNGTNWCFGDGHVKWYQVNQTVNLADPTQDLWVRNKN
jgi:prepilin-type N-terminal cleavage/methylation domain-containing protein/prepilin-type processing-associated H-X9-DG protein